jgi:hypothetical protein
MLQPLMMYEPFYHFHQDSSAINPGSLVYRSANSASTADHVYDPFSPSAGSGMIQTSKPGILVKCSSCVTSAHHEK